MRLTKGKKQQKQRKPNKQTNSVLRVEHFLSSDAVNSTGKSNHIYFTSTAVMDKILGFRSKEGGREYQGRTPTTYTEIKMTRRAKREEIVRRSELSGGNEGESRDEGVWEGESGEEKMENVYQKKNDD